MEEQDRASKTKSLKKSRPLSAFKCAGSPKILQSEGFVWVGRSGPGGSPVIKLHGANDHLVNENVDLRCVVDGSAERMRMELTESRVRREALQQLMRRRGWDLATLTQSSTKAAGDGKDANGPANGARRGFKTIAAALETPATSPRLLCAGMPQWLQLPVTSFSVSRRAPAAAGERRPRRLPRCGELAAAPHRMDCDAAAAADATVRLAMGPMHRRSAACCA